MSKPILVRYFKQLVAGSASLVLAIALLVSVPANAQFGDNDFSVGDTNSQLPGKQTTGSQTQSADVGRAPMLQGASNGIIGPQQGDATVVQGTNTAGTVRVNNLANLEALLNIIANGMEILGIAWGGPTMIMGFMDMASGAHAIKKVLFGAAGVTGGLATPGVINWLVASARDANLFS